MDDAALQLALDDVVERHEILRTSIQHEHEPRYQVVHPPSPASLDIRTLAPSAVLSRDFQCEQLLTEIEALAFDVNDLPLVRAVLARFDDQDAVLVISLHHIAVDAWSLQVVARDLALCYARRRGFDLPLPELHQYREFCVQQRRAAESPSTQPARDYWRTALDGARIFELPTQPPAEVAPEASNYAMQSFVISGELSRSIVGYAQQTRTSPYMVMLSAFYLLARELTGSSDLVVPTLTTGRHNVTFHHTVGPFLNFLPIRTDITGCQTFAEVVARTRTNCVQAYSNEIPFECVEPEAPLLFEGVGLSGGTQMSFEMLQAPPAASDELIGDLRYAEVHRRLLFEGDCADLPAGMLWALSRGLAGRDHRLHPVQAQRILRPRGGRPGLGLQPGAAPSGQRAGRAAGHLHPATTHIGVGQMTIAQSRPQTPAAGGRTGRAGPAGAAAPAPDRCAWRAGRHRPRLRQHGVGRQRQRVAGRDGRQQLGGPGRPRPRRAGRGGRRSSWPNSNTSPASTSSPTSGRSGWPSG